MEPFTITNDKTIRDNLFTEDIFYYLGNTVKNYVDKGVFAFCEFDISDENLPLLDLQNELALKGKQLCNQLMDFLNFLWFAKDNSISLGTAIIFVPEIKKAIVEVKPSSILNNCSGDRVQIEYDKSEIIYATSIKDKCTSILTNAKAKPLDPEPVSWDLTPEGKRISGISGHHKDFDYSEYNAFQRAFVFLHSARRLDYLVYRISSYMPLFECLFTTERNEVTQKVCERVAFYLGDDTEERVSIFNDMKWAYDLRSAFLHGQSPSKKHVNRDALIKMSTRLDELIRAALTMIIMVDSHIFENDIKRDYFLKYLIFGETAYLLDEDYQKKENERLAKQLKDNRKHKK